MEHAKLSPSKAERWMTCTASPHLEADMPEETPSEFAREGTEAHGLLERAIKAKTRPSTLEPEHHAAEHVDVCYDQIEGYLLNRDFVVLTEQTVKLSEDIWGTGDIVIMGRGELYIIDYKHGQGVVVEVPCPQLDIYGIAALKTLGWMAPTPIERCYTMIVQPRAAHPDGPIRSRQISPAELEKFGAEAMAIAEQIKAGDVKFCPSESACRWCRAAGNCKAQADAALATARAYFAEAEDGTIALGAPSAKATEQLSAEQKAAIVLGTPFVNQFLKAVSDTVARSLEAGEQIPGLKLVAGRSNRKYGRLNDEGNIESIDDTDVIDVLVSECKLKRADILPPKLIGPAGAEKLLDPKARNGKKKMEALQAIIVKPEGKPTVVSENDPRPAIQPHFQKVEPEFDPLG